MWFLSVMFSIQYGIALPHPNAQCDQAISTPFRCNSRAAAGNAGTCHAQWMPNGNGAAIGLIRGSLSESPQLRMQAKLCAAKASLSSITSKSSNPIPAFVKAFFDASTSPMPMILGGTPTTADDTKRDSGWRFCDFNPSSLAMSNAAAPSFNPLELPAVTLPPSFGMLDAVSKGFRGISVSLMNSSTENTTSSPRLFGMVMGTISSGKSPLLLRMERLELALTSKCVLIFPADVVQIHQVLSYFASSFCAIDSVKPRFDEAPAKTRIMKLHITTKSLRCLAHDTDVWSYAPHPHEDDLSISHVQHPGTVNGRCKA